MTAYLLLSFSTLLAAFTLAKDWKAHGTSWRRIGVLALIIGVWLAGIANIHSAKIQTSIDKQLLNSKIDELNRVIKEGQKQADKTGQIFSGAISHLTDKVADLQTKVQTDDLKQEADELREELKSTQKALAPRPKASLLFSLGVPILSDPPKQVLDISVPMIGNHVEVSFDVKNPTETEATDGYLIFYACDGCRFESEPAGWVKVAGARDNQRNFDFQRYFPESASQTFKVEIIPPDGATSIQVGLNYRCKTCVIADTQIAKVNILR
jgi:outer membrane murein-binding lipoprotein Lpp